MSRLPKAHTVEFGAGGHGRAMLRKDAGAGLLSQAAAPAPEQDRSAIFAHRAMALIKALKLPATPRIYEFSYAYATGDYPSLNMVVDDLLSRRIAIGDATISQIGAKYVPQSHNREHIDRVALRVKQVMAEVVGALGTMIGAESTFSSELHQTDEKLADVENRHALIDEIKIMMQSARRVTEEQRRLEERLNTSIGEIGDLRGQLQKIRDGNATDAITGLPNWRAFERSVEKALADWRDRNAPVSLLLGDIDDFKKFNDAWGHLTGDQVLCLVATELRQKVGKAGLVARIGGAQFAMVLTGAKLEAARALAEQIRSTIISRDITLRSTSQRLGRISLSFGAVAAHVDESPDALLVRAQTCLRMAKDRGRNRVVCEGDPAPSPELRVAFG